MSEGVADTLKRAISGRMLIVFIVGDILGAGIYALVGKLALHVGGMVWLPLAIGFAVAALTASSYAELVGKYPRAAGAALYTHRAWGRPFLTFVVAFAVLMSGVASASATAIAFGGKYLQTFIAAPPMLAAFAFLAAISFVNFLGISESVKVNLVLTVVEVSGLLIVIALGVVGMINGHGEPSRAFELETPDGAVFGLLGATALGFYALIGFEDSVNLAEECEDPPRTFPRGLFLGISMTGIIYVVVAFLAVALVPPQQLAGSTGALLDVVKASGVAFPPKLFALIGLLAIGNTALLNMIMASRLLYGMANEGILPAKLAVVHPRRKSPYVAIGFTVLIAAGLIASGSFKNLADTTVLLLLLVFSLVNVAVLVLRKSPVAHAHYRTPTWAAAAGAATTLLLASPLNRVREPEVYLTAAILVGIGAALWFINSLITGRRVEDLDAEKLVK
jgi:basic amino acid/polyamine antiporter, APA family